jgi:hypothetical protein
MVSLAENRYKGKTMTPILTTNMKKEAALQIKKEIQEFVIASENLYRLLSSNKALTSYEAEILRCCMEELSGRALSISRAHPTPTTEWDV